MAKIELKADKRKLEGRKVKLLRAKGLVPANIYGRDVKSLSIEIDVKAFREVFKKAGETGIIEINLDKETRPVLVNNVQVHPATDEILHVDFRQVNLKEKVSANIPVGIVGESPAEKAGLGTVVLLLQELEVKALPMDLPEKFEIDATKLTDVDQTVKVSDLAYDKTKVEVDADKDEIVVKVEPPQKEEVIEVVAPVEGEAPVEGQPAAEGETPAENATDQAPSEQK